MALSDIRSEIKTILEAVDDIGIVHDYDRWAKNWDDFLSLFKTADNKIHGWCFFRKATPAKRDTMPTIQRTHHFRIKGIYGLSDADASETTFQDIVEAIQDAFDSKYMLNNAAGVINSGPVQVHLIENRLFGKVLCHYAELDYEVIERVFYT